MMATKTSRADSPLDLVRIPLTYSHDNSEASALAIVHAALPEWEASEGKIEFVRFTDGITNTLLKAIKRRPAYSEHELDKEAILLRAYGTGTDVLIDRERETRAHSLLARRNLAPPLLARFENGLLYRFIEGDVCTPEDLRNPRIYQAVARNLGQWHRNLPTSAIASSKDSEASGTNGTTNGSHSRPFPNLWTLIEEWIDALPSNTEQDMERKRALHTEAEELAAKLGNTPGLDDKDYIFSHCDLLSGNVIVQPPGIRLAPGKELTVSFIDYEYALPAPAAFDIANHFAEWGGFECEYAVLPTRSMRRDFLAHYVRAFRALDKSVESTDHALARAVNQLFDQVDLFRGVPGFYWGIWALIQAQISQIDFDYASYAETRFAEYYAWKAEKDGSRKQNGQELCLRERRWASE